MNYLQLTTADAAKLSCNFVLEAEKYFNNLKYNLEPSTTNLLKTFNDYLYSINSCLDDDDICYLKEIKEQKINQANCNSTFDCVDINAQVSFTESDCIYSFYVNPFATLQLANNTTTFNAVTDKSWTSCKEEEDSSFTSATPFSVAGIFRFDSSVQHLLSDQSYIRYLDLSIVNSLGTIVSTFTADLTIGASVYYTNNASCPGCSAVTTSHLYLSNSNFPTAFATVLNNISLAQFGQTGRHNISISKTGTYTFDLVNTIRHNPSVNIYGLNFSTGLVKVYNPNTASIIQKGLGALSQTPATFSSTETITTDCGLTKVLSATGSSSFNVLNSSNFFKLDLSNLISNTPLTVSAPSTLTCKNLNYTGTYNSSINPTKGWYEGLTQLNSLNTLTISEAGTYTFKVETSSGCEDSVEVTIINQDLQ